ncbi:MAG: redox-regulated ATPase YchF [bacterium]|nr:redox-regulated ATPase YchF [bacterium]
MKIGIIGLPNVGKSTLFNALLKKRVALAANYPFATVEPNVGVVAVPDGRLDALAELVKLEEGMEQKPPIIPAIVEFVDIAGLVKGASQGAGLGNQFLSHIREVDAIAHVLRDFKDENIIREGSENPESDKETVETELALADLQTIDKLISAQEKEAKVSRDPIEKAKLEILFQIKKELEEGSTVEPSFVETSAGKDERLKKWFEKLPLLTLKPTLFVYNVAESEYGEKLQATSSKLQIDTVVISAKLEEELADYTEEERIEYLKTMGIEETGLERLVVKAYELLGLISYLTAGKKEVRAWTIKKGTKSPQAAGVIHTDFEKNFIRAQVIGYEKLIEVGSYASAKTSGLVRTEGKEYIVHDGDVIEFLVGQ